jgi:hypothetical protein
MNIDSLGGRRFIITLGCGVATTALTWATKIDANTYSLVIISTVGAYITGNTYEKVKAATS